jgi:ADP-heptose:LPS heptosyltransferase
LVADRTRRDELRRRIGASVGEKLIGISWSSNNREFGRHKSTLLAHWAPLLSVPGTIFVDLQYGDTARERQALRTEAGVELRHFDDLDLTDDLDGVAALIAACDLVITVSNTVAHIAGALGKETWVLLPASAGKLWYWGLDATTTPWYPTAKLYRREQDQDWAPVFERAARDLRSLAGEK